jgi:hypothetical protein
MATPVLLERVNTMDDTARRILKDAFLRAAGPLKHRTTSRRSLDADREHVLAADFVFSPSPAVTQSLLEQGVEARKVLETSYGWDPGRFAGQGTDLPRADGVTFSSSEASACARARTCCWRPGRAPESGQAPAGRPHGAAHRSTRASLLARPDVMHLDYHPEPAPAYRAADIFAFPTLEEGSPLVSYEAIGNGLPVITSPIGAGSVIRHDVEGLVVDPHDRDGLAGALRRLADDAMLRERLGAAARSRGQLYTWKEVARRRHDLIKSALGGISAPRSP